jgi:hypothetical protein
MTSSIPAKDSWFFVVFISIITRE